MDWGAYPIANDRSATYSSEVNANLIVKVVSVLRTEEILIVSRKMLRERAVVLASDNGRAPHETCKMDWEQAKREMCGIRTSDTLPSGVDSELLKI